MYLPNPRKEYDNFATLYIWTRRYDSPDDNPYETPTDFFREWLERLYPDASELSKTIDAWPDSGLSHRIGSHPYDTITPYDYTPGDFIYDALSNQPEAFEICAQRMPMKTIYMLDHSVTRYSTTSFGDPWDSGAVGVAFIPPEDTNGMNFDACHSIIDAEVDEYDKWVNGEIDENEDWSDMTGLRCPNCGNTCRFDATSVTLSGTTSISPEGWDWSSHANDADFAEGCRIICQKCGEEGDVSDFSATQTAMHGNALQPPIGTVIMKGACAVDAKGNDVFPKDTVIDSFGQEHEVIALEPIDQDHCWLIDIQKTRLIPHLVEKKA